MDELQLCYNFYLHGKLKVKEKIDSFFFNPRLLLCLMSEYVLLTEMEKIRQLF